MPTDNKGKATQETPEQRARKKPWLNKCKARIVLLLWYAEPSKKQKPLNSQPSYAIPTNPTSAGDDIS
jgi:hypothetical protein